MATIVEYTDRKPAANQYPRRIVSPCRPSACCFTDMEELGGVQPEGRWLFRYRRCRACGFAVRLIVREIPDPVLAAEVRRILDTAFTRNVPEL
jgi:hypothetical protein